MPPNFLIEKKVNITFDRHFYILLIYRRGNIYFRRHVNCLKKLNKMDKKIIYQMPREMFSMKKPY